MLVVTGPSGNVGRELVEFLATEPPPMPVRIASRHGAPSSLGESVRFDFFDRATWNSALRGIDTLFLLFPLPGNRAARRAIIPFIDAAESAGCRRVVYISVLGADRSPVVPHHRVERALAASAMSATILQCGFFMQNLHRALSTHGIDIADHGEVFIPAGGGRTTFLDARDAAAVAARMIVAGDPGDRVYRLTGRDTLTMDDVARQLSTELGRPITYSRPGVPRFAARLRSRGVSWDTIGFMSIVYTLTRLGLNQDVTDDVHRILHRPARTFDEFVTDSAWRWRERAWT